MLSPPPPPKLMKKLLITIAICSSFASAKETANDHVTLTKIACGSCFKPNYKSASKIWPVIASIKPQIFLFMGDINLRVN
ncbi:MAG: hypothetical protein ACI9SQ_002278 [Rubritalea sp.]|jgi:hypothetical protein